MRNYNNRHRLLRALRGNVLTVSALFLCAGLRVQADGGNGGNSNGSVIGGAGGAGTAGAPGGNGQIGNAWAGAGGGGGGAGGGAGGQGGAGLYAGAAPGGAGGAGGTAGSPNGQDAPVAPAVAVFGGAGGGGGGGGGYNGNGSGAASISNMLSVSGGNGGAGANGGTGGIINPLGGGGGGGAGGYGLIVVGSTSNTNSGTVTGGNGGNGGNGASGADFGSAGGNGGDGGVGILFSATGATLVNSGTISGGNGGAAGPGTLDFGTPQSNPGLGGIGISGGGLTITNSGVISGGLDGDGVTQADAIQFTGGTNSLTLKSGFTISGNVVAYSSNDTLALGGSSNSSFDVSQIGAAAQYQGFGVFEKTGSSTWTLTGSTVATTPWTINAGTLAVGASTALGTGNITNNGGTLTVGNGNQVITVTGTYSQTSGSTLALTLHGNTVSDQINIVGTASLGGTLTINFNGFPANGGATPGMPGSTHTYTLLTSGGLNGSTFTTFNPTAPAGDTATLVYTNDDVVLDVASPTVFFSTTGLGLTSNQTAVLGAINTGLGGNNPPPAFLALTTALGTVFANDPGAFGGALDQLTPLKFESFTSSTAFNNISFLTQQFDNYMVNHRGADGTFITSAGGLDYSALTVNDPNTDSGLQMVHSRLLAWSPAPNTGLLSDTSESVLGGVEMKDAKTMVGPEPANPWNVFISGNVVLAQDFSDPSAGLAHVDSTTGAVQLGADYRIAPNFLIGAMFGYGHTDATLDTLGSTASVDTYSPGVYASYSDHGWYANALGSYGFDDYTQHRNVSIGAFSGTATSNPGGDQIVGNLDGGYDFHHKGWTYGPTLGVQYVHLDVDGFTETGLPGDNLIVNQSESDSLRSNLGGRVAYAVQDGGMTFTPHLSASWQHEFLDQSRGITSQFDGIGAGSFAIQTANPSRDSALVDVGFDAQIDQTWTVFTDYSVQAGQANYFGQSVQAGVKIGF